MSAVKICDLTNMSVYRACPGFQVGRWKTGTEVHAEK